MLSLLLWSSAAEARAFEMSSGVRMGYSYMPNSTLRSPNSMTLGFEQIHRLDSGGSVNFLVLTNFSISGMNQGLSALFGEWAVVYMLLRLHQPTHKLQTKNVHQKIK